MWRRCATAGTSPTVGRRPPGGRAVVRQESGGEHRDTPIYFSRAPNPRVGTPAGPSASARKGNDGTGSRPPTKAASGGAAAPIRAPGPCFVFRDPSRVFAADGGIPVSGVGDLHCRRSVSRTDPPASTRDPPHEAHVPTQDPTSETQARFPEPYAYPLRARRDTASPWQGTPTPLRLTVGDSCHSDQPRGSPRSTARAPARAVGGSRSSRPTATTTAPRWGSSRVGRWAVRCAAIGRSAGSGKPPAGCRCGEVVPM